MQSFQLGPDCRHASGEPSQVFERDTHQDVVGEHRARGDQAPHTTDAYMTVSGPAGGFVYEFEALAEGIRQSNGG